MKKVFSISMLIAAAMAFVSCQKQESAIQDTVTVSGLTFTSEKPGLDGETKTAWDGSTIKWVRTDKIYVGYTCDRIWQNKAGNATSNQDAKIYQSNILDDAGVETGKFHLPDDFTFSETGSKTFYGIYPSNVISTEFAKAPDATITIPSTQTPAENSFDSTADFMIGVSDALTQITPEQEISLKWTRQVAHGQITLTAINGYTSGEAVQTIKLTANSDAYMVGKYSVPLDSPVFTKDGSNTEPNVLTIKGTNLTADSRTANVNGTDETVYDVTFWASFLPCTVKTLTVVVETDKATYTRAITLASDKYLNFLQNRRNILSIDMSEATRVENTAVTTYSLVTDASTLAVADKIIIVAAEYDMALSTEQKSSNRGAIAITKKVENKTIVVNSDVQIITLQEGTETGTFAFYTGTDGYLYASGSSGNQLKTKKTKDANGSWKIVIDANGIATIVAQGTNTYNLLQYYHTTSNTLFNCYLSTNKQKSVSIYKAN